MHTDPAVPRDLDGVLRLPDWGVARADGEQAAAFLQGQLTQDVEHLEAGHARLAGYCSPKGRLLATFVVWRDAGQAVWLAASADLLPAVVKRLSMYILRSRCRLSDASAGRPLWGLAGNAARRAFGEAAAGLPVWGRLARSDGDLIRLPDGMAGTTRVARHLFIAADPATVPGTGIPGDAQDPNGTGILDVGAWRWLEATSAVPRVVAATAEHFVPQMINLEVLGGVDFRKGCYPGQEVVARSQYRGTLKRRGAVVVGTTALQPGDEIFHSADPSQPAGEVVTAGARQADEHAAFVELKLAALEGGNLHAAAADGPGLRLMPLPYSLPAAEGA